MKFTNSNTRGRPEMAKNNLKEGSRAEWTNKTPPQAPHAGQGDKAPMAGLSPDEMLKHNPTGAETIVDVVPDEYFKGNGPKGSTKRPADKDPIKEAKEKEDDDEEGDEDDDEDSDKKSMKEYFEYCFEEFSKQGGFDFKVTAESSELKSLFEGTEIASETVDKMSTIFEAAVREAAKVHVEQVIENCRQMLDHVVSESEEYFTEQIDGYLNYAVQEWIKENELAIESGIRTEIAESFMGSLRDLLENHYMEVPESKVDLVEAMNEKIETLEGRLNEQIEKNIEISRALNESMKEITFNKLTEGMTETDKLRLKELAEGVDFVSEESFTSKVNTLKEAFVKKEIKKPSNMLKEDSVTTDRSVLSEKEQDKGSSDPLVSAIAKTISRYSR